MTTVTKIGNIEIDFGGINTITLGADIPVGHGIVLAIWSDNADTNSVSAISDSRGNAYNIADVSQSSAGVTAPSGQLASASITHGLFAGDTISITTGYGIVGIVAYDVSSFASPALDQVASAGTSYGTVQDTTTTAGLANPAEVAIALFVTLTSGGVAGSGFTKLDEIGTSDGRIGFVEWMETSTTAGVDATMTLPSNDSGAAMVAVYKEALVVPTMLLGQPPATHSRFGPF